jgi:hypothetical protein
MLLQSVVVVLWWFGGPGARGCETTMSDIS